MLSCSDKIILEKKLLFSILLLYNCLYDIINKKNKRGFYMNNTTTFNKMQTVKYLISTFLIAWGIQIGVFFLSKTSLGSLCQPVLAVMMFVPMLGVFISGAKIKDVGFKPNIKKNILPILIAWFSPAILTTLGALLYFLVFPSHFDLSGKAIIKDFGEDILKQMEQQGITYPVYLLISIISCITYAPFLNMFFALGEEVGWRGFLYPQLKAKFGYKLGNIIGGIIWGCWHWPLIWLIGYEYGTDYFGFPVVGMLLFCIITIGLGIMCDWLYEKSNCIWIPAIFHGAFNAAAGIPLYITYTNTSSMRLLGAAPNGLLSGLPILIFALILLLRKQSADNNANKGHL